MAITSQRIRSPLSAAQGLLAADDRPSETKLPRDVTLATPTSGEFLPFDDIRHEFGELSDPEIEFWTKFRFFCAVPEESASATKPRLVVDLGPEALLADSGSLPAVADPFLDRQPSPLQRDMLEVTLLAPSLSCQEKLVTILDRLTAWIEPLLLVQKITQSLNDLLHQQSLERSTKEWYTIEEASRLTRYKPYTLRQACNLGRLRPDWCQKDRRRRKWRIHADAIKWLQEHELPPLER